jgi:hypothetical protein
LKEVSNEIIAMNDQEYIYGQFVIINVLGDVFQTYNIVNNLTLNTRKITKIYEDKSFQLNIEFTPFPYSKNTINRDYVVIRKDKIFTLNKKVNRLIFLLETLKSRV